MARARLVEFEPEMESLVRFVEDCAPGSIVEGTLAKLRGRASGEALLAAAALAVSRSSELPPDHHGGPVHPVSGIHALCQLARRLPGERAFLPIVQSAALANKHISLPSMGPSVMAEVEPDGGTGGEPLDQEALRARLVSALRNRRPRDAERSLLAYLKAAKPGEVLDAMLSQAIPQNMLDDHYFLYTVFTARALDDLGWDWAPVLLRPPARYLSRHPMSDPLNGAKQEVVDEGIRLYRGFERFERMLDERGLTEARVTQETSEAEGPAIERLAEVLGAVTDMRSVSALLADALADGLSLEGTAEALSIGGALMFLRSSSGNPFDVHIHTGINARRYLLSVEGVGLRTKLLALLTWCLGWEIRHLDGTYSWPIRRHEEILEIYPERGQDALLAAISDSITGQPAVDLDRVAEQIDDMTAPEPVRETMALAQLYAALGHDPEPFFTLMAELVCRDDLSEMHAYKLQQAAYEEFHGTRPAQRWVHMVSAAKHAAIVVNMLPKAVWPDAAARLAH